MKVKLTPIPQLSREDLTDLEALLLHLLGEREECIQRLIDENARSFGRKGVFVIGWLCRKTSTGEYLSGKLPDQVRLLGNFGPTLRSYLLYQYHHCHLTQPLLLEHSFFGKRG